MLGLKGFHTPAINSLIGAYGNGFVNVVTGTGFGVPLTSTNNVEFENYLQSLFFQNYVDIPLSFNGTVWSRKHCGKVPLSKYIKANSDSRLYLGYIKIGSVEYPSRIWYADLPINDTIVWGYEQGTNLTTTATSNLVGSANSGFKGYDLETGDPFFITSGSDMGEYRIREIISDQQVTLNDSNANATTLTTTATDVSFWAGGNWFDVSRDDGDFLTALESNFNQLIVFKRESLYRYNGSSIDQVKGAPGTTFNRSVFNLRAWTVYFFGGGPKETGFYAYDSTDAYKISNGIQKYIDGINLANNPVGWKEGNLGRWYVGDIDNTDYGISIDKAVVTLDYDSKAWSIDPIAHIIDSATEFRSGNTKTSFIADSDEVFETPFGNTFDGTPITFSFTTKPTYPSGTNFNNTFTRLQVISQNAQGIKVSYRRLLAPLDSDDNFTPLGDIRHDSQWFTYPEDKNQCSGVEIKFDGISTTESTAIIKKLSQGFIKGSNYVI